MELTKEGLRVHHVDATKGTVLSPGDVKTAICGVEWKISVVDDEELAKLPMCYDCMQERYLRAAIEMNVLARLLDDFDNRQKTD